ncbi:hypothetical protein [Ureibacillus aquaedulcis]|uniref:DUF3221 domain-containing protein n=1 Tax=Ureibacillus aquaedulcis TaxID=3058421 RepID=A0ABT8GSR1_9BACL|nr:hypothetical protein [Ureibacillus sp. BA0131]MDN4494447.1 hypothetical protein [Ureibacillus sp. BA0131]
MKDLAGILFFLVFILTGCSETTSIYGELTKIEENIFFVECSDAVRENGDYSTDVGYLCIVQITENTTLRNQSRENLSVEDFREGNTIQVTLKEPKTMEPSEISRKVEAKQIILYE